MANILLPYYDFQPRTTTADHTYCFRRYGDHNCFFINAQMWKPPAYLKRLKFDLVIYGVVFMAQRWEMSQLPAVLNRCRLFKEIRAVKAAVPQDEFMLSKALCDFINEFGVDHVFTCAFEEDWKKIYSTVDHSRVKFTTVLTGYLDDRTVARIGRLAVNSPPRSVDIGYRAWGAVPWVGRHGVQKRRIAEEFAQRAPGRRLVTDISTRNQDMKMGDDWYRFLLDCKYTIGVEGGASLLDPDGEIRAKTNDYVKAHPAAGFDEVEKACFPGKDGYLKLFAISPRHLEACATRTCQVLVEGRYNGYLKPGRHYLELKKDFSNIDDVLDTLKRDDRREEITDRAYREIVESRMASYGHFVDLVVKRSLEGRDPVVLTGADTIRNGLARRWMAFTDALSVFINRHIWFYRLYFKPHLPEFVILVFRRMRGQ